MDVDLGQLREPCACGMEHNIDVEKIVIESGAVSQLEEILEEFQNPVFICDSNTRTAAEPFLEEEFKDYPVIELNPEGLQADNRGVNKVMKQLDYCDRGLSSVSVDVLVAIGGGSLSVPFMTWCNVKVHNAIGTSAAIGLPIAVAGALGYLINGWSVAGLPEWSFGYVYLPALVLLSLLSSLTAPIGARLAHKLPVATLKKVFAGVLMLLCAKMLHSLFG